MSYLSKLVAILAFVCSLDARVTETHHRKVVDNAEAKAVYFMTNQANNSILALLVACDGTVSNPTSVATGGAGGNVFDTIANAPAAPDALSSQGSVKVAGNFLFAVNAGSNTLSMFAIDPANPTSLTMIGQPAATNGDFPTSVAASTAIDMVCVAHTGAKSGVTCASFSAEMGLGAFDTLRPFNLGQTNPPTGPFNGIGDIMFNSESSALITTVKGDPAKNNTGFVSTFPVINCAVSTKDTQTSPAGTAVLFGTTLIPGTSNVLATDAAFGFAVLDLNNLSKPLVTTKIADQAATCWAVVSPTTNTGFVTDVGVNHLVEVDLTSGAVVHELNSMNGNPGMIDLQAAGTKVFGLSPGNGTTKASVTVFDVSGGRGSAKEVQNFAVDGADKNAQGMDVFV